MPTHRRRHRGVVRTALGAVVALTFVAGLVTAGAQTFALASAVLPPGPVAAAAPAAAGPTVAELIPAPPLPARVIPELPLPVPEPEPQVTTVDRCSDRSWWDSRQAGDPGDYVAMCGTWPSWVDRGETPCLPGESGCTPAEPQDTGAPPYLGPTEGRAWSPEYGYFEGRDDGPKNSFGEPCMQGRDNNDPNC
ncbi:hypothetical protein WIS52_16855 [Pseudonocardia nematodicida]|uniref:Uncharacterized protein n=1 Tax=Pseudonocardia nematodicida TaxID=1206997 RepID=A0ABV1KCV2_9PSEU